MEASPLPIWAYALAAFISIIFIATTLFFLLFSDRLILRWYRTQLAEDPKIKAILQDLAARAEIPVPRFYTMESEAPNIFSIGSPGRGSIVMTTAAMTMLDEDEKRCVLAHEIYHIKEGSRLRTVSAALGGVLASMATVALWASLLLGFGQEEDPAPRMIRTFATALFFPHAALVVALKNPESLELEADKYSSRMCQKPGKFVSALKKMHGHEIPVNPSHAPLFLVNPLKKDLFNSLFNFHPDLTRRIRMLEGK